MRKESLVEFPVIIAIQFHPDVEIIVKGYIIHCLNYFYRFIHGMNNAFVHYRHSYTLLDILLLRAALKIILNKIE